MEGMSLRCGVVPLAHMPCFAMVCVCLGRGGLDYPTNGGSYIDIGLYARGGSPLPPSPVACSMPCVSRQP